ncbi:MAG: hypothetical protein DCC49_06200 [Acidobacteria bacterium]|nr:MAG: hypothetical protein DCC49_06200 [Acidobacteriota bacterium]
MSGPTKGPRFPLFTRVVAIVLVVGLPLGAYLLQKPATQGEQGGLDLKAGGGVWFCAEGSTDKGIAERLDLANPYSQAAKGRYTLFAGEKRLESEQLSVPGRGRSTIDLDRELLGEAPGLQVGAVIELDLTAVAIAQTVSVSSPEATGTMAAPCTEGTAPARYFPGGSSVRGAETYLILFNPFPQDAVVNVDVYTDSGIERPKNLQQFPLFAGRSAVVKLSDEVRRESALGAVVRAESGQVVSQQVLYSNGERLPAGVSLSAGSTDPSPDWHFADGNAGMSQLLWIMNPGETEEEIEVEFLPEGLLTETPPPQSMRVPPNSEATMTISPALAPEVNFGLTARTVSGSGVFVDRLIGYPAPPQHGMSAGPGIASPMDRWLIPNAWGAEQGVPYSNVLSVTNPGSATAKLTIGRLDSGAVEVPAAYSNVVVPPGGRITLAASNEFSAKAMTLVGWSDEPLVVESRVSAIAPRVGFEVMAPVRLPSAFVLPGTVDAPPVIPAEATPTAPPSPSVEPTPTATPQG